MADLPRVGTVVVAPYDARWAGVFAGLWNMVPALMRPGEAIRPTRVLVADTVVTLHHFPNVGSEQTDTLPVTANSRNAHEE